MRGKTVFIIPGYKHQPQNKAYKTIARMLKSEGYSPISIKIPWKQTTISQNTDYFLKKYKKINSRKKYILGFSFGAMIAFLASTKVSVSGLILCSLSPYFKEDLLKLDNDWSSSLMSQRYQDFSSLRCSRLTKQTKTKEIHMLYGLNEEKLLIKRVTRVYRQISLKRKYLIPIQETEHNIGDRRYLHTIHQVARELN